MKNAIFVEIIIMSTIWDIWKKNDLAIKNNIILQNIYHVFIKIYIFNILNKNNNNNNNNWISLLFFCLFFFFL